MLQSLSKRSESEYEKVVGISRYVFKKILDKWQLSLSNHSGTATILSPAAQILVYILHLRHYTKSLFAAVYFNVSRTTINDTINILASFFFTLLAPLIFFGTYEERQEAGFCYFNKYITYICDGSVQKIYSTKNLPMEENFFSGKNHQHAISLLVFCDR
jgi:hypothetical protein